MALTATSSKVTITTSAKAIAASAAGQQVWLSAPSGNTGTVFLGGSGLTEANGYPIPKGTSIGPITVGDQGALYVLGTAADTLNVLVLA